MNVNDVLHSMPSVGNWRKLRYKNGTNKNIIAVLESNFSEAVRITKHAAKHFEGDTDTESAENVWDFLKRNVTYKADGTRSQDIRLPNRLLADGTGDCKSFALFAAAILANLGLPVGFRYVSFRRSRVPTHVYTIADDDDGNEIIIDAVWKYFNAEHSYTSKQDRSMEVAVMGSIAEGMTVPNAIAIVTRLREKLQSLPLQSGERIPIRNHIDRLTEWVKSQRVGSVVDDIFHVAKAVNFTGPRNAFLAAVKLNVRGLAQMMNYGLSKNSAKVLAKWYQLGGSKDSFISAVNTGKSKKPPLGWEASHDWRTDSEKNNDLVLSSIDLQHKIYGVQSFVGVKLKEQPNPVLTDYFWKAYAALKIGDTATVNSIVSQAEAYRKSVGLSGPEVGIASILAGAAGVLAALYPIIHALAPGATTDIDKAISDAKDWASKNGFSISTNDPTADPNFKADKEGFSFSSIPWWGWGLAAAAGGKLLNIY